MYYMSKSGKSNFNVTVNEDGTLHLTQVDGREVENVGRLICGVGGKEAFLALCREGNLEEAMRDREAAEAERRRLQAEKHARYQAEEDARNAAEREWIEASINAGEVIETTRENIIKVLRYLNSMNWGAWRLPKMSVAYRCSQYDCDGRQATTMKLAREIDGSSMYCFGAPRLHLTKYTHLTD